MSSLSPQISSFSNPISSFDSFKFALDFNQSIPDIMNANPSNDYLMNDSNGFISKNALFYQSAESLMEEKKICGENLKQYLSALDAPMDGGSILPPPDRNIVYGIHNVAVREQKCLSPPVVNEIQVPELSDASTVTTLPQGSLFHNNQLTGNYNHYSQSFTNKNYPPSPVSPKTRPMFPFNMMNSPFSSVDSNVTLTPGSRNEISTPFSNLTYNGSSSSIVDDDASTQCNYESNSKNTLNFNNNSQLNTQTFFSNINNQRNVDSKGINQQLFQQQQQQNQSDVNVKGRWNNRNNESTCFYAQRKMELKNLNKPFIVKGKSVNDSTIATKATTTTANQYNNNINVFLVPCENQTNTHANDVKLSLQYSPSYQVQVSLQQTNQSNNTVVGTTTWGSTIVTNNDIKSEYLPQIVVQPTTSIQQIVVQQPAPHIVYQHALNTNDQHASKIVVQPQLQPHQVQQVVVQSQIPSVTVNTGINETVQPQQQPITQFQAPQLQGSQIQITNPPVIVQLQPSQHSNISYGQTNNGQVVSTVMASTPLNQLPVYEIQSQPLTQPVSNSNYSVETNSITKEYSNIDLGTSRIKTEMNTNIPDLSSTQEESNEIQEDKQTVIINLSKFKPISSYINNYIKNEPAVLKYVPHKDKKLYKKKIDSKTRIQKNSIESFKCDICQKDFLKYYQLKAHLKCHTKEKPFSCEFCNKAFCRKHDLSRHKRIHTGDTPYICSKCFKGFARSDACRRHVRKNDCESNIVNYNPSTNNVEVAI